ncbi:hypothetical protein [Streptomyces sp. SID10815]|uniref:hypothetical protein n=1 Tax=Streptomyces sp. SID10815 TaxID=2706027 RepID=UPI001EF1AB81|nr:hypothetical protein [Streptomyces sp. SID10815]
MKRPRRPPEDVGHRGAEVRLARYQVEDEEAPADALGEAVRARLPAAQVLAVPRVLARTDWRKIADGRTAHAVHPEAVADAEEAFARLR